VIPRAIFVALLLAAPAAAAELSAPLSAPLSEAEQVRRFYESGPALLVAAAERERLAGADAAERIRFARDFLARDPDPATPANELVEAIEVRRRAVLAAGLSFFDDRGRLLFVRGEPVVRTEIECAETFRPIELWRWSEDEKAPTVILFRPTPSAHYIAWRPIDSKRSLYIPEMEYLMEQFEELRRQMRRPKRPDLFFCEDEARTIDRVTGIAGMFDFKQDRLRDADVDAFFAPPEDLAAWSRAALAEAARAEASPQLAMPELTAGFPESVNQRLKAKLRLILPAGTPLGVVEVDAGREVRLALAGVLERERGVFEQFRVRFVFPPPAPEAPIVLQFERLLRPHTQLVARLELRDEITGATAYLDHGLEVPGEARPEPAAADAGAVAGEDLGLARLEGRDTIVLLPPADEVVFGLWRAEAIAVGPRIRRVAFYVDGKLQLTRGAPPWSTELRLPTIPDETIVRVEALDDKGEVVAADELLLNEPQGEARVRLLTPPRGQQVSGPTRARAAVVVPEGQHVEAVEFRLNDELVERLARPPWEVTVDVPAGGELTYLTVIAIYEDGTRAEDFRVLNSTEFVEQIQVDLVELFVTVTRRDGELVEALTADEFQVLDNGQPQQISRFERVTDLPLTLGLALDTSSSMRESFGEAKSAAQRFLQEVMTPRDRCFAVGFSQRPALLMPLTPDAHSLEVSFADLPAYGNTALHDALVYSLYQYRGIRGRKALVLLSDGDDTASLVPFEDALAFAQRSGVAIYTIGLDIGLGSIAVREKLKKLAEETGGRTFFVDTAGALEGVYEQIERELRSQYFLAFSPDPPPLEGERHTLDVQVRGGKLKARSARGYTP
jgi:VWFA-related protein